METNDTNNAELTKVTKQNNSSDTRQGLTRPSNANGDSEIPTPPEMTDCADDETEADCVLPAMPTQTNCTEDESGETNCEVPEMPGREFSRPMDGEFMGPMADPGNNQETVLHPVAYLALGAGSVVLSLVVIYACFSGFFHKKPGTTFNTWQKFVWFVLATIVLTIALTALCYFVPAWVA